MAFEAPIGTFTISTSGDMTGYVHRLVNMSGKFAVLPSAGAVVVGACRDVFQAVSSSMEVVDLGTAKVYAASAYAVGNVVTSDASGRVVAYTPGEGTAKFHVGRLLTKSTAADDKVAVRMQIGYNEV
uniref:Uncharacterized protein n=1 Tax=viral metagenome TaxID=1070528 RepID=A0A6H1ZQY6_9ZZZZ